jgi:hypothetical protein
MHLLPLVSRYVNAAFFLIQINRTGVEPGNELSLSH